MLKYSIDVTLLPPAAWRLDTGPTRKSRPKMDVNKVQFALKSALMADFDTVGTSFSFKKIRDHPPLQNAPRAVTASWMGRTLATLAEKPTLITHLSELSMVGLVHRVLK